jgi:hypothetical protein
MFLPPNSTSLIQPMNQCVIATFKLLSLEDVHPAGKDTTNGKGELSVKDIWRNFGIKMAIDNIGDAWAEVLQSCMKYLA